MRRGDRALSSGRLRQQGVNLPVAYRYFGALITIMLVASIRLALIRLTGVGAPFVLFFGATLASSYLFGRGPGLFSGFMGSVAGTVLFIPGSVLGPWQVAAQGGLFFVEAVCIAIVTDGFTRSKQLVELQAYTLTHSEAHYRVLTEVSPQVTWEADLRGYITYTNLYWQQFSRLTATQSLGQGYLLAIELNQRRRVLAFMRRKMALGKDFEAEVQFVRGSDNRLRWYLVRAKPVMDERGTIHKWVGVAVDIEEQKRAADALAAAVRARDHFLSAASHELKTPLTSMQLMMQMMRRNWQRGKNDAYSPEKLTRLFGQIDKSVRRLTHIIDDMLDVSRITSGRLTFHFEPTDLRELLFEVVDRLAGQIEASGVNVMVACADNIVGRWDKGRLEQVVVNLLVNAIRYGDGSDIDIMVQRHRGSVSLSVRDYGPGVTPGMQHVLFQQFEQGMAGHPGGGLGLGLYLCREIVERHGGRIGCIEPNGPGAQFEVNLPLVAQALEARPS